MNQTTKSGLIAGIIGLLSGAFSTFLLMSIAIGLMYVYPEAEEQLFHRDSTDTLIAPLNDNDDQAPSLTTDEDRIVQVVEKVQPAVVSVIATADVPVYEQYFEEVDPYGNDLFDLFGPFGYSVPQYRQKGTEEREVSSGSGFLVSADGYVVTNKHVVSEEGVEYTVITNDGTKYEAQVTAKDPANDIAVIKIEGENFPYLEFGDSDQLKVGQGVIAIGNALGEFTNSVSVGVVSGLARSIQAGDAFGKSEQLRGVIQTDAAINLGNSGGPLLNFYGQVIGVNVAVAEAENIGFALPSNDVKRVVDSVKTTGKISRPYLGVRYMLIDQSVQEKNSLTVDYGALIVRGASPEDLAVVPGSPGDKAGIVENDIILEVDGQKIDADNDLAAVISEREVGEEVELKVLHDGEEKSVTVTLEERTE